MTEKAKKSILSRAREPSTWAGIGVMICPVVAAAEGHGSWETAIPAMLAAVAAVWMREGNGS